MSRPAEPSVEGVLFDPLRVPGDVATWLRRTESELKAVRDQLRRIVSAGNPTHTARRTLDRLEEILGDEERSPLWRTIRRPLNQLQQGTAARESLDRVVGSVLNDARTALTLHDAVVSLVAQLDALQRRYARRMPALTVATLKQGSVDETTLATLRSTSAVRRVARKLERIALVLAQYESELDVDDLAEGALGRVVLEEGLTTEELGAAWSLRRKVRQRLAGVHRLSGEVAGISREQLHRLEEIAAEHQTSGPWADPAAPVLEQLSEMALSVDRKVNPASSGAAIVLGATAALHNATSPIGGRYGWHPRTGLLQRRVAEPPGTYAVDSASVEGVTYVVPIGGPYCCLTPDEPSLVRVYSRAIAAGSDVQCQIVVPGGTLVDERVAALDAEPLFDGLQDEATSWYRNVERATLTVLGSNGREWFAKVAVRGRVEKVDQPAWRSSSVSSANFRILRRAPDHLFAEERARDALREFDALVSPVGPVVRYCGLATVSVLTPYADAEIGWLRHSQDSGAESGKLADMELELFRQLARHQRDALGMRDSLSLKPVAGGRLAKGRRIWPLYELPVAVRSIDSPTLREWLSCSFQNRERVIRGVARILIAAHDCGWSLRTCDERMFAFGASWENLDSAPEPRPYLVTAPLCAAIGKAAKVPGPVLSDVETYSHVGVSIVHPKVAAGELGGIQADGAAFAAFVIDLQAMRPVAPVGRELTWDTVWSSVLSADTGVFYDRELVHGIATSMQTERGPDIMAAWIRTLARAGEQQAPNAHELLAQLLASFPA